MNARRANHNGGVYEHQDRANKPWEARIRLPPDGKPKSFYFKTKTEAEKKLREVRRLIDQGQSLPDERMTLAKFASGWLERKQQKLKPKTMQRYREIVKLHIIPALGYKRIALLREDDVEKLCADKLKAGLSTNTVHHIHTVLHGMLESAVRRGYATSNVSNFAENKPGIERKRGNVFSREEARRFLQAVADDPLEALYLLALTTGMRQGEILGLCWQHVDLDRGTLTIQESLSYVHEQEGDTLHFVFGTPKTERSERPVCLAAPVVDALRRHKARQNEQRLRLGSVWDDTYHLVFCNGIGRPIEGTNFLKRSYYPLLEKAGLPHITFHGLRRTIATLLAGKNAHPKDVSSLLGHSSTQQTLDVYTQVLPETQVALAKQIEQLFWGENDTNVGQIVGQGS